MNESSMEERGGKATRCFLPGTAHLETGKGIYLRSPASPRGQSPRTSCLGCLDRRPESPQSSGGSRCGHRLGAEPVTPGGAEDPHRATTRPGPSHQKLVQPHLIACFLPANRVHSGRRAGSGPGNPSPRRAARAPATSPWSRRASRPSR